MEALNFDSGIKEYQINGKSVLRFNPSDPNVYGRFIDAVDKIKDAEKTMAEKFREIENGEAAIRGMCEADGKIKAILNGVFGQGNDFNEILEGVNLMAVATNGNRVIENLINALLPIMEKGAKECASGEVEDAKNKREQRRAMQ